MLSNEVMNKAFNAAYLCVTPSSACSSQAALPKLPVKKLPGRKLQ
jgi:hypothetical protein